MNSCSCGSMLLLIFLTGVTTGQIIDLVRIEQIARRWAPLIWMSPNEKYMPLGVEEFLENVHVAEESGKIIHNTYSRRFSDYNSSFYLVTRSSLEILKSDATSFLYGKNPKENPVPVYAVITYCSPNFSFHSGDKNTITNDINTIYGKTDQTLNFHVSYWMFYPYNAGKHVCFLGKVPSPIIFSRCVGHFKRMSDHVGDWEHMSLSFSGNAFPNKLFLSVHDFGIYYVYDTKSRIFKYESKIVKKGVAQVQNIPPFVRTQGGHPVLFSAYGSHGLWSSPGEQVFLRVPLLVDQAGYGIPWKTWDNVLFYHLGKTTIPDWMTFKGKWGNPKSNCVLFKKLGLCEYTDGPSGVLRKNQDFRCGSH